MENKELSIVIVNYNSGKLLKDCLNSLSNDLCPGHEVIVVDNASTDRSAELVRSIIPDTKFIFNEKNEGFSKANNIGINISRGKHILILNPDVVLGKGTIKTMIELLEKDSSIGMATCKLVKPDGKLDLACRRSFPTPLNGFFRASGLSKIFPKSKVFSKYNLTHLHEDEETEVDAICGAFIMARRKAIEEVGLLDENFFMYGEDLDWCMRFKKKGWKVYYYPKAKAVHHKGGSASKNSRVMINEFFKSMKLFYNKHHSHKHHPVINWVSLRAIDTWKFITHLKNELRIKKKVTP